MKVRLSLSARQCIVLSLMAVQWQKNKIEGLCIYVVAVFAVIYNALGTIAIL